jgi:hypothetical protein
MLLSVRGRREELVVYGCIRNIRPTLYGFTKRVNRPAPKRRHETEHEEPKPIVIKTSANIMVNKLPGNRQRVKAREAN